MYQLVIPEPQESILGYVNSQEVGHHVPEEFINFDGINSEAGEDASIHKDQ